jgi:hypothetical protein
MIGANMPGGYVVRDANRQALVYVYSRGNAALLTLPHQEWVMREQLIGVACATTALGCLMSNSLNAQTANQEIKKCVEGAFALEEFKKDGVVYRSPQIAGRYVVLDGTVSFIFHDRTQQSTQISYVGFGPYTIDATAYAYHYDDYARYTSSSGGTSVSRQSPWDGMMSFKLVVEQDGIHLRNAEAQVDFQCSPDTLLIILGPEGNYRKYRRLKSE